MNGPPRIASNPVDEEDRRLLRTGLAFLLAPGIAAIVGSAIVCAVLDGGRFDFGSLIGVAFAFALVGYPTELILAAPVYMALPDGARGARTIVPSAGVVAAAPWALLAALSSGSSPEYVASSIAFGFGCVGGMAFVLIRGTPPW